MLPPRGAFPHTAAGAAVSAREQGLLPISQHAMRLTGNVACHDYEGVALDLEEQERLVRELGGGMTMILCNHGLLACGRTVRSACTCVGARRLRELTKRTPFVRVRGRGNELSDEQA